MYLLFLNSGPGKFIYLANLLDVAIAQSLTKKLHVLLQICNFFRQQ